MSYDNWVKLPSQQGDQKAIGDIRSSESGSYVSAVLIKTCEDLVVSLEVVISKISDVLGPRMV